MKEEKIFQNTLDKLPVLRLFNTFSMAIGHNKLLIAFIAVAVMGLVGFLMDMNKSVKALRLSDKIMTELDVFVENPRSVDVFIESADSNMNEGVFATMTSLVSKKFNDMVISLLGWDITKFFASIADLGEAFLWAFTYHPLYIGTYIIIFLAVMSFCGGAICRIAALEISRGEKLGAIEAMRFSREKFWSLFCAPLLPVCIVAVLGVAVLLLGLLGNIPIVGEISIGLFLPFALILGAMMTLVVVGALAGGGMKLAVIAYEVSDSFDAISRTFSYVYTKPWHLGSYHLVALIYGGICYIFVRFFAFIILSMVYMFLWLSLWTKGAMAGTVSKLEVIWPGPEFFNLAGNHAVHAMSWSESIAAFLVNVSVAVVMGLVMAFIISFFYCSSTTIYALMRNKVDNVPISDINLNQMQLEIPTNGTEKAGQE
jgi:hypothetical protein